MKYPMYLLWLPVALSLSYCASAGEKPGKLEQTITSLDGEEVIPLKYRSIYIHHFDNRTFQTDMVRRLKERLQTTYQLDGRLKVRSDKESADLWLYGTVEQFGENPVGYDNFGQPTQFLLTLVVTIKQRVNLQRHPEVNEEQSVLLENRVIRFDTTWAPRLPPFESQFNAQERLILGISERIVHTSFDGWYSDLKTPRELNYDKYETLKKGEIERVIRKDLPKEQRQELLERYRQYDEDLKQRQAPQDDLKPPPPGLRKAKPDETAPPVTN